MSIEEENIETQVEQTNAGLEQPADNGGGENTQPSPWEEFAAKTGISSIDDYNARLEAARQEALASAPRGPKLHAAIEGIAGLVGDLGETSFEEALPKVISMLNVATTDYEKLAEQDPAAFLVRHNMETLGFTESQARMAVNRLIERFEESGERKSLEGEELEKYIKDNLFIDAKPLAMEKNKTRPSFEEAAKKFRETASAGTGAEAQDDFNKELAIADMNSRLKASPDITFMGEKIASVFGEDGNVSPQFKGIAEGFKEDPQWYFMRNYVATDQQGNLLGYDWNKMYEALYMSSEEGKKAIQAKIDAARKAGEADALKNLRNPESNPAGNGTQGGPGAGLDPDCQNGWRKPIVYGRGG